MRFSGRRGDGLSRWRVAPSGKAVGISLLCTALLAAVGYAYVLPRLGSEASSTCALQVPSPQAVKESASFPVPAEPEAKKSSSSAADGCTEIADITGEEDTLYWLLSANVQDEATVVNI